MVLPDRAPSNRAYRLAACSRARRQRRHHLDLQSDGRRRRRRFVEPRGPSSPASLAPVAGAISMAAGEDGVGQLAGRIPSRPGWSGRRRLAEDPRNLNHKSSPGSTWRVVSIPNWPTAWRSSLTAKNALGSARPRRARDCRAVLSARPFQAAYASAISFAYGRGPPAGRGDDYRRRPWRRPRSAGSSLICLVALGGFSAVIGGAPPARAAFRVAFWGVLAMGLTAGAGWVFGLAV